MATKKKAKRGKKVKKGSFFKDSGGLFNKSSEVTINPTKKFIQNLDDNEDIELTEKGKSHFNTLKKQKYIEAMEPSILLDDLFKEQELIKLNRTSFLELEENETIFQNVIYHLKNEDNIWLFFRNKAVMLDFALTEELSFEYENENILKYPPILNDNKIFFTSNKEVFIYNLSEKTWSNYSISGEITSSVIFGIENIFLVIDFTKLICLNNDFKENWSFITEGYLLNSPIIDNFVYITSSDGMLYKLDKDGDIIWSFNSKYSIEQPALLFNNVLIISSMSGKLFFIDKDTKDELSILDLAFPLSGKFNINNNILYAFNRRFLYKIDLINYKISSIIMFEKSIESISILNDFIHIRTNDSKSILVDEALTNISITNFNAVKAPIKHMNFLISIDNDSNLLKTEII